MGTPFLSQIALFSFGFPPKGWASCSGQLLPINQNQALFSLLGTTYGGNGQTTFALPDLRGRAPLGFDPLSGQEYLGGVGGSETITLTASEIPQHTHVVDATGLTATARCKNGTGNQWNPVGTVPAIEASGATSTYRSGAPTADMGSGAASLAGPIVIGQTGASQPHNNQQPYLVLSYCIALQGIFPSQNP